MNSKYVKSAVLGANDGIITTFAVVAGVAGAGLNPNIIIILGVANMIADGLSMGLGDFLGERSEEAYKAQKSNHKIPRGLWKPGLINFLAFIAAGTMPLAPYIGKYFGMPVSADKQFPYSILSTAVSLFFVGSMRSLIIKRPWWKHGFEMLAVGSIAAFAAYFLGAQVEKILP